MIGASLEETRAQTEDVAVAFDVLDILGFASLARRSPTLDGSVPLRVAQACQPLLEGNAFGFQLTLGKPIELRRRFGRFAHLPFEGEADLQRMLRAGLPMLAHAKPTDASLVQTRSPLALGGGAPVSLFTGLFVRPRPGHRLRLSSTKNRRSFAFAVREVIYDDASTWVPLVLGIDPVTDACTLEGEIATLAVLPAAVSIATKSLEDGLDVAKRHVRFYDEAYFRTKRGGEVSRKYRREERDARPADSTTSSAAPSLTVVEAGPRNFELRADRVVVTNAVGFAVSFDGLRVRVEPDGPGLESYASAVRARWSGIRSELGESFHEGALLYLTKYFTPHPNGEPHFFVKPSALFETQPGTSLLLEGASPCGLEVLRGVVATDRFHAAPAVFQIIQTGKTLEVPAGTPLLELFPVPRALVNATFEMRRGGVFEVVS